MGGAGGFCRHWLPDRKMAAVVLAQDHSSASFGAIDLGLCGAQTVRVRQSSAAGSVISKDHRDGRAELHAAPPDSRCGGRLSSTNRRSFVMGLLEFPAPR